MGTRWARSDSSVVTEAMFDLAPTVFLLEKECVANI